MPLVFIFFIWYGMYGRNNPKIYSKLHDKFGLIVFLLFIFSGLSSFSSSFGVLLLVSLIIAVVGAPFWLIAWLISKSAKGKARQKQNDYDYYTQHYSQSDAKAGMTVTGLTKAVPKRRKIIQKFNQKYDLYLTDEEINRIVDASYMSNCWEREILDMDQKYDTISQWYRGDSAWLRHICMRFQCRMSHRTLRVREASASIRSIRCSRRLIRENTRVWRVVSERSTIGL